MSSDDEIPNIPRPARVPSAVAHAIADAATAEDAAPRAEPKTRAEVIAAGALFMALLGMLTVAVGVVTFAIF